MYNEEIALKRKCKKEKLANHDRFMKYQLISVWLLKLNNGNEARLNTRRSSSSSSDNNNNNHHHDHHHHHHHHRTSMSEL